MRDLRQDLVHGLLPRIMLDLSSRYRRSSLEDLNEQTFENTSTTIKQILLESTRDKTLEKYFLSTKNPLLESHITFRNPHSKHILLQKNF